MTASAHAHPGIPSPLPLACTDAAHLGDAEPSDDEADAPWGLLSRTYHGKSSSSSLARTAMDFRATAATPALPHGVDRYPFPSSKQTNPDPVRPHLLYPLGSF